jgi:cytochrome c biogenesis protein ResB
MSDLIEFLLARIEEDEENVHSWWHLQSVAVLDRALAECEAKRRMIAHYSSVDWNRHRPHGQEDAAVFLRLMALPYANHPDYRSHWSP